jgi:hypothetical protein
MRTPILKFAAQEHVTARYLYKEAKVGRLVLTKVGRRTFVDEADAERWRALAPKFNGTAGDRILAVTIENLKELGNAVAQGLVDRAHASARLVRTAQRAGLLENRQA